MIVMRAAFRTSCYLLLGALALRAAAEEPPARFRLVTGKQADSFERRLQSSAANGYRLVAAAEGTDVTGERRTTALMEYTGQDAPPRAYEVVGCSGNLRDETTRRALADLGARGYFLHPRGITVRKIRDHWLPESASDDQMTLVLERATDGSQYAFDSLAFGDYEPFYRDLAALRSEGHRVVGMWSTGRRLQVVLQKRTDQGTDADASAQAEHRLLIMATRLVLGGKLETAAGDGFRILAADDPTTTGPPLMLLERTDAPRNPIEYKFLDDLPIKQNKDNLQTKLNGKARKGWRVSPRGTTAEVVTLQRAARKSERTARAEYLLLSSRRAPGLPRSLEEAASRGFEFVRLFVEPDETTVLLEKLGPLRSVRP